jgi:RHS repeat-associated protein
MYRAYDPYSARWLSRDPSGEQPSSFGVTNALGSPGWFKQPGSPNLYEYVNLGPVNNVDPWGLTTYQWGFTVGGSAFGFGGGISFGSVIGGGGAGFYGTVNYGGSSGEGIWGGVGGGYSTAKCITDLGGPFHTIGGGGGTGTGAAGGYFWGNSPHGPVRGGEAYIGPGGGVSVYAQTQYTWIVPIAPGKPAR